MRWKARFIYLALCAFSFWTSYNLPELLEGGTRLYVVYMFALIGPFFGVMLLALALVPSALDQGNKDPIAGHIITAAFLLGSASGVAYFIYILYHYF